MDSLWKDDEARNYSGSDLDLRVYTSRLLGRNPSLVLHGGGNTSVKSKVKNLFGDEEYILFVKGSGWDLETIEAAGFAPVRMDLLLKMAALEKLSDSDMVKYQRAAMTNPDAPNPSVEAIMHAIIPFKFVDHTHADAVVTVTNTENGLQKVKDIYGDRILIVPYVMPGFVLARKIYEMTRGIDWDNLGGIILMNHGIFSFDHDGRKSYEKMISLVSNAEDYLRKRNVWNIQTTAKADNHESNRVLLSLRKHLSALMGAPVIVRLISNEASITFSSRADVREIATRGPVTPDHVIRTKRIPMILSDDPEKDLSDYAKDYEDYFNRNTDGQLTCLDRAPRWIIWPKHGLISIGKTVKDAMIIEDIVQHTIIAIQWAEGLDKWVALSEKEIFEVEYWDLEQAKLKKSKSTLPMQGKVALVTGAASGIGKACVNELSKLGANVIALDIDQKIHQSFKNISIMTFQCDITDTDRIETILNECIMLFGGLDIVVSNAGIFPTSKKIEEMASDIWDKSLSLNLTSHQVLMQKCIPLLKNGMNPSIIFIGSKNVPAPGPGASAYSVAKAGLTQLARIAAMELAEYGIRVNVIHPNNVFDTGIWTEAVLQSRAKHYNMSVDEYKANNLLKVQVTSSDVAQLASMMAGTSFLKTTGAQIPIDGGNERVI